MIWLVITSALFVLSSANPPSTKKSSRVCFDNEFECKSGKCIPLSWQCDGDEDCDGADDEEHCERLNCGKDDFRCTSKVDGGHFYSGRIRDRNAQCIPRTWVCDGEADCRDGSDEKDCSKIQCGKEQFECPAYKGSPKVCLPESWKCDGQNDCTDMSDEKNCDFKSRTCMDNEFRCDSGVCIFKNWKCDGDDDCGDGSDEKDEICPANKCDSKEKFQCKTGGMCISRTWVCDGEPDCTDRSDEVNCTYHDIPKPLHAVTCIHNYEFKCKSGNQCINKVWRCDGEKDCGDGSDEEDCKQEECKSNQKKCKIGTCIDANKWCDGKEDCLDGSDEAVCPTVQPKQKCEKSEYQCPGLPLQCVSFENLCVDGVASNDCVQSVCNKNIKLCEQDTRFCNCRSMSTKNNKMLCYCESGFELKGKRCVDIDECQQVGICSQKCINTEGSYICECHPGYRLSLGNSKSEIENGKNVGICRATGSDPLLLLSNRAAIRRYDLITNEYKPLVAKLDSAVAMDFLHKNRTLIWSDVAQEKIMICRMDDKLSLRDVKDCKENMTSLTLVANDVNTPDGLAADWIHQLLFWTDTGLDQINVVDLVNRKRYTLFKDGLDEPRAIAVDPLRGLIFWTDWGANARIERAGMDGSDRTVIITGDNVQWPNGLALDILDQRVYWADAKAKVIMSCDYWGNKLQAVLHSHERLRHPFSLAVFEERLYWTDWDQEGVLSANKFTGRDLNTVMRGIAGPMTVRVYHEMVQPDHPNKCFRHECDHICLPRPHLSMYKNVSLKGLPYKCACENGYVVRSDDNRYCISEAQAQAILSDSTPFSLPTIFFFLLLSVFAVVGYLWYRRRPNRFVILHVDNPVYRRTVEEVDADMEPFSDGAIQQNGTERGVKLVFEGEQREHGLQRDQANGAPPLTESMSAPLTSSMVL